MPTATRRAVTSGTNVVLSVSDDESVWAGETEGSSNEVATRAASRLSFFMVGNGFTPNAPPCGKASQKFSGGFALHLPTDSPVAPHLSHQPRQGICPVAFRGALRAAHRGRRLF